MDNSQYSNVQYVNFSEQLQKKQNQKQYIENSLSDNNPYLIKEDEIGKNLKNTLLQEKSVNNDQDDSTYSLFTQNDEINSNINTFSNVIKVTEIITDHIQNHNNMLRKNININSKVIDNNSKHDSNLKSGQISIQNIPETNKIMSQQIQFEENNKNKINNNKINNNFENNNSSAVINYNKQNQQSVGNYKTTQQNNIQNQSQTQNNNQNYSINQSCNNPNSNSNNFKNNDQLYDNYSQNKINQSNVQNFDNNYSHYQRTTNLNNNINNNCTNTDVQYKSIQ